MRFQELMAACDAHPLLEHLVCEETPGSGCHYGYLCAEWIGSTTLSRCPVGTAANERGQMVTLIESRGRGSSVWWRPRRRGFIRTIPQGGQRLRHSGEIA